MRKFLTLILILPFFSLCAQDFYMGVDLSYTNEMEDCDVVYNQEGVAEDPFTIFAEQGANLARFRLWHTPDWTSYSTLADVKISIARARAAGMDVLLDFHNSDTWADPGHQLRPAAWNEISDTEILGDSLYNYTKQTLQILNSEGLVPDMVQIGNETNGNILLNAGENLFPIDWGRNVLLFSRGLQAVEDFNMETGKDVKTVLHIAQPETALWWFDEAAGNGLTQFDIIGISYYPGWSSMGVRQAADAVEELLTSYGKEVMIVETAYPWTLEWADNASNNMGEGNFLAAYGSSTSPQTQYEFLSELTWLVKQKGGSAVMFWEPGWVSTDCYTPWGQGSHWENVALFDFDYNLHEGAAYLGYDYTQMPAALEEAEVTFKVDMTGIDVSNGVFVTGDFTGENWQFMEMTLVGNNIYEYTTTIPGRSEGAYIFQNKADWGEQWREPVPEECAPMWNTHRQFVIDNENLVFGYVWGSCTEIDDTGIADNPANLFKITPNPARDFLMISGKNPIHQIEIIDLQGNILKSFSGKPSMDVKLDIANLKPGIYLVKISVDLKTTNTYKIVKK